MKRNLLHGLSAMLPRSWVLFLVLLSLGTAHAVPWLPFGPDGGDARRFASDPHDHSHLYLGTANGWIYESHNAGESWKRLTMLGKRDDLILDSIVVDPADSRHIVVGAYAVDRPDGGLYISYDGGANWISQAEMRGQSIRSLSVAPSDSQVWVAGTLKGVYRSTDGAKRWKLISPPDSNEIHEVESVAIDPTDPAVIYVGTWHLPWKTTDAGQNWANIKNGIIDDSDVFSIIIDPDAPQTVYASACSGIYKSVNAGNLFVKVQGIPSEARRTRVLLQDPGQLTTVFAGTTEGLFRSGDSGKIWSRITGSDIIVNDVYIQQGDSKHVLIATDRGGVLASNDGGDTFRSSNGGFSARQITSLRHDSKHPATLYAGVVNDKEWGGVFESDNGGVNWTQRSDGLAGRDVFSLGQAPDGTIIAGTAHGLYRLESASETWNRVEDTPRANAKADTDTPPALPSMATRPPVPVGRNQFAKSQGLHGILRESAPKHIKGGSRPAIAIRPKPAAKKRVVAKAAVNRRSAHPLPLKRIVVSTSIHPVAKPEHVEAKAPALPTVQESFDGKVFSLVTAGDTVLGTSTEGLLSSKDNGLSWQPAGPSNTTDWRLLAAAGTQVAAASMYGIFVSSDAGTTWKQVPLPEAFSRVAAIAVEPTGTVWIGGQEGVFVSSNAGETWTTPKNLYTPSVNSIFFDQSLNRILVTSQGPNDLVFSVQLPERTVTFTNTGWGMRFVRPVGDHLIAVTPYDGIVIQPKMIPSPVQQPVTAQR